MKKISINLRLFFWFSFLVALVILTILILNTAVLENYYLNFKEESLAKTYNSVKKIYKNYNESSALLELEKIETNQNIDIVIKDNDKLTIYSTNNDFSNNMIIVQNYTNFINTEYIQNRLSGDTTYFTEVIRDDRIRSDFVTLFGKLENGNLVFMRTPIESIKESVIVTNRFLTTIGILAICGSCLLAFLISKSFTRPIKELNAIAKNISELDFSKSYNVTTEDEIGMLGKSINVLSKSLENKIQELSDINLELEKDIEEKSKLAEMRSQFVSDVSHELKTPIALIQGYAEGLVDGVASSEEDIKYYCEVILDEANKMNALTHDLLDLSNLEYGKNNLNIEKFNIIELISNILKKNEIRFNEKEISPSFEHNDETLYTLGDIFRIEQVITNYINNALKNVDDQKEITIRIDQKGNLARIFVYNSGKQISKDQLLKIWNKFYKIDASRNRDLSGSGIGLSLVKAIMDQHKNNYGVENKENGVEFWFELNISTDNSL
ncbi:MAG: HAMP domain-containing protein [Clostridia bacterium]|nr:HAMP domain-containing protein [Clostridia bacterium]